MSGLKQEDTELTYPISPEFIHNVLDVYDENCRYIHDMHYRYQMNRREDDLIPHQLQAEARFSIEKSSYIKDTGHFNAVEFILCFNQIAYVLLAKSIQTGLIKPLHNWKENTFYQRQLPDVLILSTSASFKRAINAKNFFGKVYWDSAHLKKGHLFMNWRIEYFDDALGKASGKFLCCIQNINKNNHSLTQESFTKEKVCI